MTKNTDVEQALVKLWQEMPPGSAMTIRFVEDPVIKIASDAPDNHTIGILNISRPSGVSGADIKVSTQRGAQRNGKANS